MAELRRRFHLSEKNARFLTQKVTDASVSAYRQFARFFRLRHKDVPFFDVNGLVEFARVYIEEGYAASYVANIISAVTSTWEMVDSERMSSLRPAVSQLRAVTASFQSRFRRFDLDEVQFDLRAKVAAWIASEDARRGCFEVTRLQPDELRDRFLMLLRLFLPLRSADVARIWFPSVALSSRGRLVVSFRMLFRKTDRRLSPPIRIMCICEGPMDQVSHPMCLACAFAAYVALARPRALCQHVYSGQGDPCQGSLCFDRSFLFMSSNRRGSGDAKAFFCVGSDRIGSLTKSLLGRLELGVPVPPHAMRAMAARLLEQKDGELIARWAGGWSESSNVFRSHYNPVQVAIIPAAFREEQLADGGDD